MPFRATRNPSVFSCHNSPLQPALDSPERLAGQLHGIEARKTGDRLPPLAIDHNQNASRATCVPG